MGVILRAALFGEDSVGEGVARSGQTEEVTHRKRGKQLIHGGKTPER